MTCYPNSVLQEVKPKLVKDITADVRSQIIDPRLVTKTFDFKIRSVKQNMACDY